jgi:hypothetical protein
LNEIEWNMERRCMAGLLLSRQAGMQTETPPTRDV